jgi:hypothetical protein
VVEESGGRESTPCSTPNNSVGKRGNNKSPKKTKAVRRLQFEDDKSSPVSGTIIRDIGTVRDERHQLQLLTQTSTADKLDEKYEETPLGIQVSLNLPHMSESTLIEPSKMFSLILFRSLVEGTLTLPSTPSRSQRRQGRSCPR